MNQTNNYKNEKGSVSLYALIGMLILLTVLLGSYIYNSQKYIQSLDVTAQIKATYEKDVNNIAEVYTSIDNGTYGKKTN